MRKGNNPFALPLLLIPILVSILASGFVLARQPVILSEWSPIQLCFKLLLSDQAKTDGRPWGLIIPFLLIAFVFVFHVTRQYWLNRRFTRQWKTAEQHYLDEGDVKIAFTILPSDKPAAFTAGLLRPRIYVSSKLPRLLPPDEMRAVLLHEYYHQQAKDPLKLMLLQILASTFWFLPVLRKALLRYELMVELKADRFVIDRMNSSLSLGAAILTMKRQQQQETAFGHVGFTNGAMEMRIRQILEQQPTLPAFTLREWLQSGGAVLLLFMLAGSCL